MKKTIFDLCTDVTDSFVAVIEVCLLNLELFRISGTVQWIDSKSGKDTTGIQFGYCLNWMKDDAFRKRFDAGDHTTQNKLF